MIFALRKDGYQELQSLMEVDDFLDLKTWVPCGFNIIKNFHTVNKRDQHIFTKEQIVHSVDCGFYYKKFTSRVYEEDSSNELYMKKEMAQFSSLFRGYSELDLNQLKHMHEKLIEDTDMHEIELDLLITPFKNWSFFIIFMDKLDAYRIIFDSLDRMDHNNRNNSKQIATFYRKMHMMTQMIIPPELEDIGKTLAQQRGTSKVNYEKLMTMHRKDRGTQIKIYKNILMRSIYL